MNIKHFFVATSAQQISGKSSKRPGGKLLLNLFVYLEFAKLYYSV